ncbi:hypothetical protein N0V93_000910 [Gnomoniopsis smithogilvyi]|uniref:Uncharacterized protein n=1 Tax=Gnomoniopsis smithogilvyi TaxID=1191159 RepID=A0A9W8Z4K9_9PEZI|nr:hypothetical protein N0V93_000910 [Gnomoniopsis smithogilvyi]
MTITQFTTRQVTSNTTVPASDATSTNNGGHRLSNTVLAVMIPLIVILAAAIIGMSSYFFIRMRRRRLRRTANQGEGQTDGGPFGIGPPMEEGLNELGEAPPPYVSGGVVKDNTGNEVVEEVFDEPTEPPPAYLTQSGATAATRGNSS